MDTEKEMNELLAKYTSICQITEGSGQLGQEFVDKVYDELAAFVQEHPQYGEMMPRRVQCTNNGHRGFIIGFGTKEK